MVRDRKIIKFPRARTRARGRSSTQDILGGPAGGSKIKRKWAEHHKRLIQLREQFLKGKSTHTEAARNTLANSDEHIADSATDSYDRDCALALLSSTQDALFEIDQAIRRILDGSYGICELSGRPIEAERLRAIPWTRFSTASQVQVEARGISGRVRLGQLGIVTAAGTAEDTDEAEVEEAVSRKEAA